MFDTHNDINLEMIEVIKDFIIKDGSENIDTIEKVKKHCNDYFNKNNIRCNIFFEDIPKELYDHFEDYVIEHDKNTINLSIPILLVEMSKKEEDRNLEQLAIIYYKSIQEKNNYKNNFLKDYNKLNNLIKTCLEQKTPLKYPFFKHEEKDPYYVTMIINELQSKGYKPEIIKDYEFINNLANGLPYKEIKLTLICDF